MILEFSTTYNFAFSKKTMQMFQIGVKKEFAFNINDNFLHMEKFTMKSLVLLFTLIGSLAHARYRDNPH